jgi:hypothetical protein
MQSDAFHPMQWIGAQARHGDATQCARDDWTFLIVFQAAYCIDSTAQPCAGDAARERIH